MSNRRFRHLGRSRYVNIDNIVHVDVGAMGLVLKMVDGSEINIPNSFDPSTHPDATIERDRAYNEVVRALDMEDRIRLMETEAA